MKIRLQDEWIDPNSMFFEFQESMEARKEFPNGNPDVEITIKGLPIGREVVIDKRKSD